MISTYVWAHHSARIVLLRNEVDLILISKLRESC